MAKKESVARIKDNISRLKKAIMEILFLEKKATAKMIHQNMKNNFFFKIEKNPEISALHRNLNELKAKRVVDHKKEEIRGFYRYYYFLTRKGRVIFEKEMKKEENNLMPGFVVVDFDRLDDYYCSKCSQDKHSCFKEKAELLSTLSKRPISPALLRKYLKYPLGVIAFIKYKSAMESLKANKKMAEFAKKIYLKKAVSSRRKAKKGKIKKAQHSRK